jgi:hypothetical protein
MTIGTSAMLFLVLLGRRASSGWLVLLRPFKERECLAPTTSYN